MRTKKRGLKGLTLVEMMLSTVIFSMMMGGLVSALLAGRSAWEVNESVAAASKEARNALWNMSRDLRQAKGVSINQTQYYAMCSFIHPTDGNVSYMWSHTSEEIYRSTTSGTRVVARNISEIDMTDHGDSVDIQVTAQKTAETGETTSLTLEEKVYYRS